ncbi:hypothetical protein QAD02_006667 [Eretmocerus hayati]|uniref:Uncharacterized protein n=1 Tax=Eretmocerus hayati TaxID=131215 RepID=A0ACC2N1H4_9HYME|nr:hypothetical protein QAD02_006667 [Eretmocerus hayati]
MSRSGERFIIKCEEDGHICQLPQLDVVCDFKTVKVGDIVSFWYSHNGSDELYKGEVLAKSEDVQYIKALYNEMTESKPHKIIDAHDDDAAKKQTIVKRRIQSRKANKNQTQVNQPSSRSRRPQTSRYQTKRTKKGEPDKRVIEDSMNNNVARTKKDTRLDKKAENLKKAQERMNDRTRDFIISSSSTCTTEVCNTSSHEKSRESTQESGRSSSTLLKSISNFSDSAEMGKQPPASSTHATDENDIEPSPENHRQQRNDKRTNTSPPKEQSSAKKQKKDSEDIIVDFERLGITLRSIGEEQLYGENYEGAKMVEVANNIFCKSDNLTDAVCYSENARQSARRLMLGIFRPDALLNNSMTGKRSRGSKKKFLNPVATRTIIDFTLQLQKKKLKLEGTKKWKTELTESSIKEGMRMRLVEFRAENAVSEESEGVTS